MKRLLLPIGALLLAPVLAACGDDGGGSAAGDPTSDSASPTDGGTSPTDGGPSPSTSAPPSGELPDDPAALRDAPCQLARLADVSALYGVDFAFTGEGGGSAEEAGWEYEYAVCTYTVVEELEVTLAVAGAEDFVGGELGCPPVESYDKPVREFDLYGGLAQWTVHTTTAGKEPQLRVCANEALIDIEVVATDGDPEGNQKRPSLALARLVIDQLRR